MSKTTNLIVVALLLSFMLVTFAARPDPTFSGEFPVKIQPKGMEGDESCEGEGKEECLIKRTLAAHVDYIYTQGPPPPPLN